MIKKTHIERKQVISMAAQWVSMAFSVDKCPHQGNSWNKNPLSLLTWLHRVKFHPPLQWELYNPETKEIKRNLPVVSLGQTP